MEEIIQPLDWQFCIAVMRCVRRCLPDGFDVSENAPNTYEALKRHYGETGRIVVWSGGSDRTIFGSANAGVNHAFRAWHDFHHIMGGHDFSFEGEQRAAGRQIADVYNLYGCTPQAREFARLIEAEVVGQAKHFEKYGEFPIDQMGFIRVYVESAGAALAKRW